jgi:C4-dicarboxylate-specific signal transduction histidine kinase
VRHTVEVLARNAIEATPPGRAVRVVARRDQGFLDCSVHDGGAGLDGRDATHLFDPFYCGRQAGRGLGLGLPRVARSLELLGGTLRWRSNPGQGAAFHVRVPLEPIPGIEPRQPHESAPEAAAPPPII